MNPPVILDRGSLARLLPDLDLTSIMEEAFAAYSAGRAQVSAVGELRFAEPPGDVHVKAGHLAGDDIFVVKVATGFYDNPRRGLPSSSGLVLAFDAATGAPRAILLDEGLLTDHRTAAAGAVAARHLAPAGLRTVGVLGAGTQARLQLEHLARVVACRDLVVWARRADAADALAREAQAHGWSARTAASPAAVAEAARLIVTTTPSTAPLLSASDVAKGTHITAVGADSEHKQELASDLLLSADLVVADSLVQCRERGELRHAWAAIDQGRVVELGALIQGQAAGRTSDDQITIADLTGVAVQDVAIARAVLAALASEGAAR